MGGPVKPKGSGNPGKIRPQGSNNKVDQPGKTSDSGSNKVKNALGGPKESLDAIKADGRIATNEITLDQVSEQGDFYTTNENAVLGYNNLDVAIKKGPKIKDVFTKEGQFVISLNFLIKL